MTLALSAAALLAVATAADAANFRKRTQFDKHKAFPGKIGLVLPTVIYATPGVETNVYYDNVCLVANPADYVFDASFLVVGKGRRDRSHARGVNQVERFTLTPKPADIGERPFMIQVRDESNAVIACAKSSVRIAAADAGAGKSVTLLFVGDAHADGAPVAGHVLDLCKGKGNPKLTAVTARAASRSADFAVVFGRTKGIHAATERDLDKRIAEMVRGYDAAVKSLRSARKDTKIGILLPAPPYAATAARPANSLAKRNLFRAAQALMKRFGSREKENIFVVPANVNLDCVHNYAAPKGGTPAHPDAGGYQQIGDAVYCWMKTLLTPKSIAKEK